MKTVTLVTTKIIDRLIDSLQIDTADDLEVVGMEGEYDNMILTICGRQEQDYLLEFNQFVYQDDNGKWHECDYRFSPQQRQRLQLKIDEAVEEVTYRTEEPVSDLSGDPYEDYGVSRDMFFCFKY